MAIYNERGCVSRRAFISGALSVGALSALALSGCGGSKQVASGSASDANAKLDSKQELNLDYTDLQTLDVNDIRNSNEFLVLSQVQEGLFRTFTKDGKDDVQNAGCESYDVSDDKLTYTFHLRKNSWSDGQPVVAQDYVDSLLRLVNPDNGFSYSYMAADIVGAQDYMDGKGSADAVAVKAVDDYTLEYKIVAPIPFFTAKLANVCFFPVRKDLVDKYGKDMANDYTKQVYNGPFVISDRVLDNSLTLKPNDKYWDAKNVKLTKVTYTVVAEEATKSQLLSSKQLDAVKATTEYTTKWQKEANAGKLVGVERPDVLVDYLSFNMHTGGPSGLMNNEKVRLALSLAIDRDDFNKAIFSGLYKPAYGLVPDGIKSGDKVFRDVTDEPLKAVEKKYKDKKAVVALFKEGLKEVTGSDDPKAVTFTILGQVTSTQDKNRLEWFQQEFENVLGVKVNINSQSESASFVSERNANNYDFYVMGWMGDFSDPVTFMDCWFTTSGYAKFMGGYSNADFDKDYDSLQTMSDEDERLQTYQRMEKNLVADHAGMAPLVYGVKYIFNQTYVKDLSLPQFGTDFEVSRTFISGK